MKKWVLISIICLTVSLITSISCLKEADLPALKTAEVSTIKEQSASFGGNIINDGGAEIELVGVCWGTEDNPTFANLKKFCKSGNINFNCYVFDLIPETYYHVRAFAINRAGTAYGNEVHFRTNRIVAPGITTTIDTLSLGFVTAKVGGKISGYDKTPILDKGVCWSTAEYPLINNNRDSFGAGSGSFTDYIAYLQPGAFHYLRAYAVTVAGTDYGNEIQFKTRALPAITVSEITSTTARVGGKLTISDPYDLDIIGICYGPTEAPTINGHSVPLRDIMGNDGTFYYTLKDLTPGTWYYVRSYFFEIDWDDSVFTAYGNVVAFITNM